MPPEKYETDALVTADWVEEHLEAFGRDDPDYRLVEADIGYDSSYAETHIPNAIGFRWDSHLQDSIQRDILHRDDFAEIMGEAGITADSTVVLYGDESNQWAAYTYWQFKYYGHDDVRLLVGGRPYWMENDFPTTDEQPDFPARDYDVRGPYDGLRIYRERVEDAMEVDIPMVDVRSAEEYRGKRSLPRRVPKLPSERAISPVRRTSRGRKTSETMDSSKTSLISKRCTRNTVSTTLARSSRTTESASGHRSAGLRSTHCSAGTTSGITTARGPNGGISSGRQSPSRLTIPRPAQRKTDGVKTTNDRHRIYAIE